MGQEYIGIKGQLTLDDKIYITASEDNTIITSGQNILSTINMENMNCFPYNAIYFSASKADLLLYT